jgi:hypothetical protein
MIEGLKRSITELECAAAQKMEKELEELRQELERTKNNSCDVSTVQSEVDKVTDKFVKMKDIYNKLREEHIVLLRTVRTIDDHNSNLQLMFDFFQLIRKQNRISNLRLIKLKWKKH